MDPETIARATRLAEEAQNAGIKVDLATGQIRHLLEEHRTIHPKLQTALQRAKDEHDRKLRRLLQALNGDKR